MEKKLYKRRRYIVRKELQLKYVGLILTVVLLSAVVAGYTIYYNSWALLGDKLASVYPQGRLAQIFRTVNIRLVVNLIFVSMFCVGIGILTSHKIAGPVFRMVRFLNNVAEGDYTKRVHLRKGDQLQDLAEAINKVVDKLEGKKS